MRREKLRLVLKAKERKADDGGGGGGDGVVYSTRKDGGKKARQMFTSKQPGSISINSATFATHVLKSCFRSSKWSQRTFSSLYITIHTRKQAWSIDWYASSIILGAERGGESLTFDAPTKTPNGANMRRFASNPLAFPSQVWTLAQMYQCLTRLLQKTCSGGCNPVALSQYHYQIHIYALARGVLLHHARVYCNFHLKVSEHVL